MAKRPEKTGPARSQSRRLRQEAQMQRIVLISVGIVAALVIGLVGYAVVNEYILKPNRVIIDVNGATVTATEFEEEVRFNYYRSFGAQPPEAVGLDPFYIGQLVYDGLINDLLLEQKAAEMEISVSDAEIQEEIELAFGYDAGDPEPTPTSLPTVDVPDTTPTSTPTFVYTQTPQPTATLEPGVTPSPTVELTPTPDGPTPTPEPTEPPLPSPTPVPVTEDSYTEQFNDFVTEMSAATGLSEARIHEMWRKQTRLGLLRERVLQELDFQVDETKVRVHVAHLLVDTQEEVLAALERITNGEDFGVVAAEVSRDDGNAYKGGDLGWFGQGVMVAAFEDAAFAIEPGEVSGPVQTEFGFHLIKVLDKDEQPLSGTEILQAQQEQFQQAVEEWRGEADLVIDDSWQEFIPTVLP